MMIDASRVVPIVLVVVLLATSGCRTYGDEGFDSEAKLYSSIQAATQQLERSLERAESDLQRLEDAAERADTLDRYVREYRSLVHAHRAMVEDHKHQAEGVSADASYRTLHRIYGAMVTDQRLVRQNYRRAVRGVWAAVRDTTLPRPSARMPSRYSITPVQYPRVGSQYDLTMADALRVVPGARGLQREERPSGE